MSATPRPWRVYYENGDVWGIYGPGEGQLWDWTTHGDRIVETDAGYYPPREEDAELIVRAVNAFDALLAVAKACNRHWDGDGRSPRRALDALDVEHPGWREWAMSTESPDVGEAPQSAE